MRPCSYRLRLLYTQSTKWVIKNDAVTYPLQISFPDINLTTNPRNSAKLLFAMDANQILIIKHALRSLQFLNVFMMYHMARENIFRPSIYTPV